MKYRTDIDGLRALAAVPVVLYHTGVPGFGGGFVGVDIFFVISFAQGDIPLQFDAGHLTVEVARRLLSSLQHRPRL
jgi:hypothetical protein